VPSPPKMRMASASVDDAGRPTSHVVFDSRWNGVRSFSDDERPKMAAARISPTEINKLWRVKHSAVLSS